MLALRSVTSARTCGPQSFSRAVLKPTRNLQTRGRQQVVYASKDEAIKEMKSFQEGVAKALKDKEQELKQGGRGAVVAAVAVEEEAEAEAGLRELTQDDFYSYLEEAGETLVVVDFFTDWCGPCKLMYPQLVKLAAEEPNVKFVKFNCNRKNKELGVSLGIKVAPTFQFYRSSKKIAEMTGAKIDELKALVEKHK